MKAIVRRVYGSTDELQLADIDPPKVVDDEVMVRVRAAGVDRQLRAFALSPFVTQKLTSFIPMPNHHDLVVLEDLIEEGKVRPVIDRTSPLADTAEAIRRLEQGRVCGKLVITI